MNLNLQNKNAIVCASSQGLGKAAALDLAQEGVNLAICSRDQKKIDKVKEEIIQSTDNKIKVIALKVDLDSSEEIQTFFQQVENDLGSIDILVNNNGGPPPSTFEQLSDEDWQKAFNSTMMSCLRLSRLVIPNMQKNGWGRIINISSVSVKTPVNGLFLSNSLRKGVLGFSPA